MEKLANDYPKSPHLRYHVGECLLRISMVTEGLNEAQESAHYFAASQAVLKKLAEDFPACPKYRRHHAQGYVTLGKKLYVAKADDEAEKALREGVRLWPLVVADFPTIVEFRDQLGSAHGTLGQLLFKREKYQEAEEAFREMLNIHQKMVADFPKQAEHHASMGVSWTWVGHLREKQNRPADAIESFDKAIVCLENAVRMNPRQRTWLANLRGNIASRSNGYLKLGKTTEYQRDLERVKDLDEALDSPLVRLIRLDDRGRRGDTARALREADDLLQNIDLNENQYHDLALFYTMMSGKMADANTKETMGLRAVTALGNAVELGFTRVALNADGRFRPLAQREDYRRLIQGK